MNRGVKRMRILKLMILLDTNTLKILFEDIWLKPMIDVQLYIALPISVEARREVTKFLVALTTFTKVI